MATRGSSRTSQRRPPAGPNSKADRRVDKCDVFYISLASKLDVLEQAIQPKWLTLEWVSLAVEYMRSTFSDMMALFEDLRAISPEVKGAEEYWVEEYMEESMKLLDVCNVLKPAISRFEHLMMCVQLVVQSVQRCGAESQEYASDKTLIAALQSCERELTQLVHPLLTVDSTHLTSQLPQNLQQELFVTTKSSTDGPHRFASIAIGEKFTADGINPVQPSPGPSKPYKSRGTVALTLVMRATRETTDFVASVLIWALKRDPSAHPASTAWQRNLEVFRGDETLWSPAFRRLQERLRKEMFELLRDERCVRRNCRQFAFEELRLVETCTADLRVEIEVLAARKFGEKPTVQLLETLEHQLKELLAKIQVRLEKVSSQVNQLFNELVHTRKKLLDAAQRPGSIHRAQTF